MKRITKFNTAIRDAKPGEKPVKLFDKRGLFLVVTPPGVSAVGWVSGTPRNPPFAMAGLASTMGYFDAA